MLRLGLDRTCAELMWEDGGKMREAKGERKDKSL
jgi:hypothetical protein